jgi:DNA polymerase I-like protein with 3'-5' exonuclease and polymerase domains
METSIILSSGSLIALLGFYFKLQKQTVEQAAEKALILKRIEDLEKDMIKSNKDIDDIKNILHSIDMKIVKILTKLENEK